ncbi:hypothetical protein RYX36_034958, partial [Vicia faba]
SYFSSRTKIVGTLGLKAGMSLARFDFSRCHPEYHQETLENLKTAINSTKKLCVGQEASSEIFPINFDGLVQTVKTGDTIFIGQYLFMGSETTTVWLEVSEVKGNDVVCIIKNSDSGR